MINWDSAGQYDCPRCREPLEHDRGVRNQFCVTCDRWLHADCLAPHAAVDPLPDGDWQHREDDHGA
jgi:LSD1 subclass zinc finger protein